MDNSNSLSYRERFHDWLGSNVGHSAFCLFVCNLAYIAFGGRSFLLLLLVFIAHFYCIAVVFRVGRQLVDLGDFPRGICLQSFSFLEVILIYMMISDALNNFSHR